MVRLITDDEALEEKKKEEEEERKAGNRLLAREKGQRLMEDKGFQYYKAGLESKKWEDFKTFWVYHHPEDKHLITK